VSRTARWLLRAAQLALLIAVGYGVWRSVAARLEGFEWQDLASYPPNVWLLALSSALLVGVNVAHAFLWRHILRDLGIGTPSARTTLRIYFVSSLGRYLPGKLWQLAGLAAMSSREGMPALQAGAASMLGQLAFLTTGLLLLAALLPEASRGATALTAAAALTVFASATFVVVATPIGHRARVWLERRGGPRLGPRLRATLELADRIRPRDALLWLAGYGATWVVIGIAFTLFAAAFVPGSIPDARQLAAAVAASYLAGLLLFTPAGIGVREGALLAMLAETQSIPGPAALLIAALSRIWFTAGELLPLLLIPAAPNGSPAAAAAGAGQG
jgi:uncharacterized membrane protein YbhN (UPF0104 family)